MILLILQGRKVRLEGLSLVPVCHSWHGAQPHLEPAGSDRNPHLSSPSSVCRTSQTREWLRGSTVSSGTFPLSTVHIRKRGNIVFLKLAHFQRMFLSNRINGAITKGESKRWTIRSSPQNEIIRLCTSAISGGIKPTNSGGRDSVSISPSGHVCTLPVF